MFHRKVIFSFCLALLPLLAAAQDNSALPVLRYTQDPSRAAMAGAGLVSSSSAAWSAFENAAASLDSKKDFNVAASYTAWKASDYSYYNAAGAWNLLPIVSLSVGLSYGSASPYDIYSEEGRIIGQFAPNQLLLNAGVGVRVLPELSLAVNVHRASETLAPNASYSAFSADALVLADWFGIKFAAGVMSLGSKVKSASGDMFNVPSSAKLALGYENLAFGPLVCALYADADYFFYSSGIGVSAGASFSWNDLVVLRGGYHYGNSGCVLPSYASLGAGVQFQGLHLDLSCLLGGQLSGTLQLALAYSF